MAEYLPLLLLRLSHSRNVAVLSLRTDGFLHNTDFSFVIWFTQLVESFRNCNIFAEAPPPARREFLAIISGPSHERPVFQTTAGSISFFTFVDWRLQRAEHALRIAGDDRQIGASRLIGPSARPCSHRAACLKGM